LLRGAKFQGARGPGSESSREQIGQVPIGRFAPERIGPGAKKLLFIGSKMAGRRAVYKANGKGIWLAK